MLASSQLAGTTPSDSDKLNKRHTGTERLLWLLSLTVYLEYRRARKLSWDVVLRLLQRLSTGSWMVYSLILKEGTQQVAPLLQG